MRAQTRMLIVAYLVVFFISNIVLVKAQTVPNNQLQSEASNFCTRLNTLSADLTERLAEMENKRATKRTEILTKVKENRDNRLVKTKVIRNDAIKKLEERLKKLDAAATTDVQKKAMATFRGSVKTSLTTRNTAIDGAESKFRTTSTAFITQRQNGLMTAVATFKYSVQSAVAKAKNSCTAGSSPETVKQTFVASVKTAKDQLANDIRALDQISAQIDVLAKTKNETIKLANRTFKASLKKAIETLKTAFPA